MQVMEWRLSEEHSLHVTGVERVKKVAGTKAGKLGELGQAVDKFSSPFLSGVVGIRNQD